MNTCKKITALLFCFLGSDSSVVAQESNIENDYVVIVRGLYQTFETDTARIGAELDRIDQMKNAAYAHEIDQLIKKELAVIAPKFAAFVTHELTAKQRALLVQLLTNIKNLTSTTAQEFTLTRHGLSDANRFNLNQKMFKKQCEKLGIPEAPERIDSASPFADDDGNTDYDALENAMMEYDAKLRAWLSMTEHITVNDASYNVMHALFRKIYYFVEDLRKFSEGCADSEVDWISCWADLLQKNKSGSTLVEYCDNFVLYSCGLRMIFEGALLSHPDEIVRDDASDDAYNEAKKFFEPFEKQKCDQIFARVHLITSQLLEVIAHEYR